MAARCSGSGSCTGPDISSFEKLDGKMPDNFDIEKASTLLEHVLLDVQGLTCVGCEMKLFRSLRDVPGVPNLRTSLVLSQADFDLDEEAGPVVEVIKSVERTTGFTCKRLNDEGQDISVVVDGNAWAFVERKYPAGVTEMVAINKQIVRITYDAKVVGATQLVEECFNSPLQLCGSSGFFRARKWEEARSAHGLDYATFSCSHHSCSYPGSGFTTSTTYRPWRPLTGSSYHCAVCHRGPVLPQCVKSP